MEEFSAFRFESALGKLKRKIKGKKQPLHELLNNIHREQQLSEKPCQSLPNNETTFIKRKGHLLGDIIIVKGCMRSSIDHSDSHLQTKKTANNFKTLMLEAPCANWTTLGWYVKSFILNFSL